jgi:hypothetical protein
MKLFKIKQVVYDLTHTKNTKQLKKKRSDLTKGKDLRYKSCWIEIFNQTKLLKEKNLDISLQNLEASEKMLKNSLLTVGRMAGLNDAKIEVDWERIQLETQLADIHLEEL